MAVDSERVLEVLAGEYVLGVLDTVERDAAEALLASDPAFARSVHQWEARLAPLAERLTPVAPPPALRDRIMAQIGAARTAPLPSTSGNVVRLNRQVAIWRGAALAASALAAVLAGVILLPRATVPDQRYVAVLEPEGAGAAFLATIDLKTGTVSVRRTGTAPEAGKSHELWAIGAGRDKPQSLGVVDANLKIPLERLGPFDPATVFAISLEPAGGSPTGQPTGPVLYTGKLVQTE